MKKVKPQIKIKPKVFTCARKLFNLKPSKVSIIKLVRILTLPSTPDDGLKDYIQKEPKPKVPILTMTFSTEMSHKLNIIKLVRN